LPASRRRLLTKYDKASQHVLNIIDRGVAQIAEQNLSADTHQLPIVTQNLPGGVYNIRLATAQGTVITRLVVVK
jgi:hypothetical protein